MHTSILLVPVLGFCLLASCAAPPPPAGNQSFALQSSDFAPPKRDPRSNPPPAPKPRVTRVSESDSGSSRSRTTQVDGRTVIDTPPEDVEPVKTVPLEVDR